MIVFVMVAVIAAVIEFGLMSESTDGYGSIDELDLCGGRSGNDVDMFLEFIMPAIIVIMLVGAGALVFFASYHYQLGNITPMQCAVCIGLSVWTFAFWQRNRIADLFRHVKKA
jgi:hypothetical protein